MILEFAPLEGITTYLYRNAYARHFGSIDKYYTPFISLHKEKEWNHKERQEILPENNKGIAVIPQVLTNSAEDFLKAAEKLRDLGYEEVNINFGCPSGTVTTKAKGAGMLGEPLRLERFLDEIFERTPVKVSVKTRLGMEEPEEWPRLLGIYNQYPLQELIIHARVREDFYKNTPNWEAFGKAMEESKNPVCYNGDVFSVADYKRLQDAFPKLERIMLGRGLIANPGLAGQIREFGQGEPLWNTILGQELPGRECGSEGKAELSPVDYVRLQAFHREVYGGYQQIMPEERNVLFKMKELWVYMLPYFPGTEKLAKKLRKANTCVEYENCVKELFRQMGA